MPQPLAPIAILALLSGLVPASAQVAGDATLGQALARDHCARCHDVEPGGAFKQSPPSFAAIAVYFTPDMIQSRILFPNHMSMPQLMNIMDPGAAKDILAYIVSLEPK